MTNKEVIRALWSKDWCLQALILCFLAICGALYPVLTHNPSAWHFRLCGAVFGILAPSVFDSLGFTITQGRDADISENRGIYRVIQNMSQWGGFYVVVGLTSGWWVALGSAAAWWMMADDLLFYILRKETLDLNFTWLTWTLPAILLQRKSFSKQEVIFYAVFGAALAFGSAFL